MKNLDNFDKRAEYWDTPSRIHLGEEVAKAIMDNIPITKNFKILDFGAGTGLLSFPILPCVKSIYCIDSSQGMIDILTKKSKGEKIKGEVKDIFDVQGNFDMIISNMTLHHIEDSEKIANKLFTLTNQNGYIAISDLAREDGTFHYSMDGVFHNGFLKEDLVKTFEEAGFREIKVINNIFSIERNNKKYPLFLLVGKR